MSDNQYPIFYRYRLLWHLLFWSAVFLVYWLTHAGYQDRYQEEFFNNLYLLPARMIGTYVLIYLILPLATRKKQFVLFAGVVVIHAFFYGFLIYASYYIINPYPEFFDFREHTLFYIPKILTKSVSEYALPVIAASIVLLKKWYHDEMTRKKLAEEKLEAELNFLKSQVHPHFLFNTLNNLYGLTLTKSDKASDIVLKLSDLLDYMIYKSNDEFVPLTKELEIIGGYIELEKMRYSERLNLNFNITGQAVSHKIAPLILLPFIENCFKHGASKDRTNPLIEIQIEIQNDCLKLHAHNSIPNKRDKEENENEGVGLKNVRRRLELIYPNQHELIIKEEENNFTVELKIVWSE